MKHHHLIVELSAKQKEFQAFFKKELEKFGVDSPADLSDEQKKKFFNAVDKGFKAKNESAQERRTEFLIRIKENIKLRRDYINRTTAALTEEDDDLEKGAASDPEISGKKSHLVIEFPDEVRVEFLCKADEVEDVKTRAQELHDEGSEVTEVTAKIAEEFPGCTFEIQGGESPSEKGKKKTESSHKKKKVRESFVDYVSGMAQDPGKGIRDKKMDRVIAERVVHQLQRLNTLVAKIRNNIQETTPKAQRELTVMVKENLEAVSERLAESLEEIDG